MKIQKFLPLLLVIAVALVIYVVPELIGSDSTRAADVPSIADSAGSVSDLPPIAVDQLPLEALDTIDLIDSGGPYPFDRDDLIFQNREGLLPDEPQGYYREYTVITPGENDRGARRIVAGEDGELYYTADHYSSFAEILFDS